MKHFILILITVSYLISCRNDDIKQSEITLRGKNIDLNDDTTIVKISSKDSSELKLDLPFIGKKEFETNPGSSGSGTPQRYIEILENGDVFFGFFQQNRASGEITEEQFYAGKFKTYLKCFFKKWENDTLYYKVSKEKISRVDKNHKILVEPDCCIDYTTGDANCPCESKF